MVSTAVAAAPTAASCARSLRAVHVTDIQRALFQVSGYCTDYRGLFSTSARDASYF